MITEGCTSLRGLDPKAKMIKQFKKDAKKIDEILQYKDYWMENLKKHFF
jgi:hypothetical protein